MNRVILHCDCNSFYASVEAKLCPALRDVPMAVCGDPKARHGIILAKNELARAAGVKTAETIREAKKKCPSLTLVPPHHDLYASLSREIFAFYNTFTDQVEPFGIDEAWLDVTGSQALFGTGPEIAERLRVGVKEKFGITISVGVSFNKVFAKLASDYKKPDAVTVFAPENWRERIHPLPVGDLLFVGRAAREKLERFGIGTIGELAAMPPSFLSEQFGKMGEMLHVYANGLDESPVSIYGQREPMKSCGNSVTFSRDLQSEEDVCTALVALADKVSSRLRRHGVQCQSVSVVIKDPTLHSITRQAPLPAPTDLSDDLFCAAKRLVLGSWDLKKPIRMLGITATKLVAYAGNHSQISLFDSPEETLRRHRSQGKDAALDRIRSRFGKDSISSGASLFSDIGLE